MSRSRTRPTALVAAADPPAAVTLSLAHSPSLTVARPLCLSLSLSLSLFRSLSLVLLLPLPLPIPLAFPLALPSVRPRHVPPLSLACSSSATLVWRSTCRPPVDPSQPNPSQHDPSQPNPSQHDPDQHDPSQTTIRISTIRVRGGAGGGRALCACVCAIPNQIIQVSRRTRPPTQPRSLT